MPTKDDGDIAIEARDVEKTEEYATKQYFNKEGPMTKAASGILLGLGFLSLGVLLAGQQQAHATPGSGCKQWAIKAFDTPTNEETLPEGWEPFTAFAGHGGVGARRCLKE